MFGLDIRTIAKACSGVYYGPEELLDKCPSGIVTDSRKVEPGFIYAAIKGARSDGHDYIKGAIADGAICAIAEHQPDNVLSRGDFSSCPYILVENTGDALRSIAEYFRLHTNIKVVGITGSVGKTSTKETIAAVLSENFKVHKTAGNFNNQLGVPLTMFGLHEDDEILVMEMGISHFGDMNVIARIARPNISVITNIANCHLEALIDRNGVLREKSEIFKWMIGDGPGILNGDDDKLITLKDCATRRMVYCSTDSVEETLAGGNENNFFADNIESLGLKGTKCTVYGPDMWSEGVDIMIPVPGRHMVNNALTACAVAHELGMEPALVASGLMKLTSLEGRGQIISTDKYDIMNDCYNANPSSMKASINTLTMALGRKVAILGDMFELGDNTKQLHYEVGEAAALAGIDVVLCIGELAENIAGGARSVAKRVTATQIDPSDEQKSDVDGLTVKRMDLSDKQKSDADGVPGESLESDVISETTIVCFGSKEEFLKDRNKYLHKGDTILVKASHGMHLEEIVEALKTD